MTGGRPPDDNLDATLNDDANAVHHATIDGFILVPSRVAVPDTLAQPDPRIRNTEAV